MVIIRDPERRNEEREGEKETESHLPPDAQLCPACSSLGTAEEDSSSREERFFGAGFTQSASLNFCSSQWRLRAEVAYSFSQ